MSDDESNENNDYENEMLKCMKKRGNPIKTTTCVQAKHDRDGENTSGYDYQFLLSRLMDKISPEKKRKRTKIIPHVNASKIGSRKTIIVNYDVICSKINRTHTHVMEYILSELSTTGSIDSANRLLIKGIFKGIKIDSILSKYVDKYVRCDTCLGLFTELESSRKSGKRMFIKVCDCGATNVV